MPLKDEIQCRLIWRKFISPYKLNSWPYSLKSSFDQLSSSVPFAVLSLLSLCFGGRVGFEVLTAKVVIQAWLEARATLAITDLIMHFVHRWMHEQAYFLHKKHHSGKADLMSFLSARFDLVDLLAEFGAGLPVLRPPTTTHDTASTGTQPTVMLHLGSLALFWCLTNLQLLSLHQHELALGQGNQQRTNTNSAAAFLSMPRVIALYFPQFHPDPINDRLWRVNFTDWDSLRRAPKTNRLGYQIPRPTELGYYDLSDAASDIRRKQGELAREYGIDAFAYHHYWFYDEEHPGPNLETPLELMLEDGEPDVQFCLHWAAMKWVNTWQSSGGNSSVMKQPKDGVLQLQNFPDPNEAEGLSKIEEHYNWLRRFFHHKNYIKIDGQPLFMLYQKKPKAAPVLDEFRRLAIEDGFSGMYFTVGLTRPHGDLQSFFPFRGIQRFKGFDAYNATVAYPNPADWTNRTLTVPDWCIEASLKGGDIAVKRRDQKHSTEIPGIIVSFDNTPRRSFEEAIERHG